MPSRLLLAAFALPLLFSCDRREGVSVRDEPHPIPALPEPAPAAGQAPAMPKAQVGAGQSLWAGGFQAQDGRWIIFKTIGDTAAVAAHRAELEALAKNDTDHLPDGWTRDEATSQFGRLATLRAPAPALEISISAVGGDIAGNVNRWRGQAGLTALPPAEAEAQVKKLDEKSGAWSFEVAGEAASAALPRLPAKGDAVSKEIENTTLTKSGTGTLTRVLLSFTLPPGWAQVKPSSDMRLAQFDAAGCEVAITRFPGTIGKEMGPTLDNLNRWRGQVGLAPLTEMPKTAQAVGMEVAGYPAAMVQVAAAEGEPVAEKAMLVAFVADEKGTFFIKLTGTTDKVEAQLMPMVDFLKSLKLPFEGQPAPLPADLRLLPMIGGKK